MTLLIFCIDDEAALSSISRHFDWIRSEFGNRSIKDTCLNCMAFNKDLSPEEMEYISENAKREGIYSEGVFMHFEESQFPAGITNCKLMPC